MPSEVERVDANGSGEGGGATVLRLEPRDRLPERGGAATPPVEATLAEAIAGALERRPPDGLIDAIRDVVRDEVRAAFRDMVRVKPARSVDLADDKDRVASIPATTLPNAVPRQP